MISENTEVIVTCWLDPFSEAREHVCCCKLKDSLSKAIEYFDNLEVDEEEKRYYQISVNFVVNGLMDRVIYSYYCDKKISVREEFIDILRFIDGKVSVIKKEKLG